MRRSAAVRVRLLLAAAASACLPLASGCTFAHDRIKDAVDIVGFKLVAGPGTKVGLGFGAAKTGMMLGYYRFQKFGFQGRAMGVWEETGTELFAPADHRLEAVWGNKELFDMVAEFQLVDGTSSRAALFDLELTYPRRRYHVPDGLHIGDIGAFHPVFMHPGLLGLGDVQITVVPLFLGFELNLSLYQLADFVAGWVGIDIARDDTRNYTPVGPTEEQLKPPAAAEAAPF
ncbi:MAG: hypothetical protein KatS3mg102_2388 [Planctomycetota bacterium]|nr:MAG: hypothetical protein KatS3mg102_2388 [Planctomycetota bacterium]